MTARLIRAPEVCFAAAEIGLDAFGHNIENRHLIAALDVRGAELPLLRRIKLRIPMIPVYGYSVTAPLRSIRTVASSRSGRRRTPRFNPSVRARVRRSVVWASRRDRAALALTRSNRACSD